MRTYEEGVRAAREAIAAIPAGPQVALYRDMALSALDALTATEGEGE